MFPMIIPILDLMITWFHIAATQSINLKVYKRGLSANVPVEVVEQHLLHPPQLQQKMSTSHHASCCEMLIASMDGTELLGRGVHSSAWSEMKFPLHIGRSTEYRNDHATSAGLKSNRPCPGSPIGNFRNSNIFRGKDKKNAILTIHDCRAGCIYKT